MSYVDPKLRPYFESLSIDLKNEILKQDVEIKSLSDPPISALTGL